MFSHTQQLAGSVSVPSYHSFFHTHLSSISQTYIPLTAGSFKVETFHVLEPLYRHAPKLSLSPAPHTASYHHYSSVARRQLCSMELFFSIYGMYITTQVHKCYNPVKPHPLVMVSEENSVRSTIYPTVLWGPNRSSSVVIHIPFSVR